MLNASASRARASRPGSRDDLPALARHRRPRRRVSIWGRTRRRLRARPPTLLADAPPAVVAVEVNLSCPNLEDAARHVRPLGGGHRATSMAATRGVRPAPVGQAQPERHRPRRRSPAPRPRRGAEAVTLVNTVLGMAIDPETRRPRLGAGGGGLSGPAIHPVAVRAVHDVHAALPGPADRRRRRASSTGADAVELLLAGARAVQVGTATFADPRRAARVLDELEDWCRAPRRRRPWQTLIGGMRMTERPD